ncbi:MAG: response regulator [Deltaproteobacteria bacterium]|nr:response regulator [Deltaproteobacteria bacterium]
MKTKKVLVIDDERIVTDSVTKILEAENFEVEVAASGRQGVELALQKEHALVLTDLRMPDIGGMRVLRDIKRARPALPVIMITGFATVRSAVQAMKLGAAEFLEKPFAPDDLMRTVRKALYDAQNASPVEQSLVHQDEVLRFLDQVATDQNLSYELMHGGADALEDFDLTGPEKLAILTADIDWIEKYAGQLNAVRRKWLESRRDAGIW